MPPRCTGTHNLFIVLMLDAIMNSATLCCWVPWICHPPSHPLPLHHWQTTLMDLISLRAISGRRAKGPARALWRVCVCVCAPHRPVPGGSRGGRHLCGFCNTTRRVLQRSWDALRLARCSENEMTDSKKFLPRKHTAGLRTPAGQTSASSQPCQHAVRHQSYFTGQI